MKFPSLLFSLSLSIILGTGTLPAEPEWRQLFDKDLSLWELWMGIPHKSVTIPGYPPSTSENSINGGEPLGLNKDPLKVFQMKEEDGKPLLYITGQIYGGLTTLEEFENYHFSLQFKWGEKRWQPRPTRVRDSGLLIHCVGGHGAFWKVWMRSLECQIQENDCGDFYPLAGTSANVRIDPKKGGKQRYGPNGTLTRSSKSVQRSKANEKPHGEWNTIEVYTIGDTTVFVVNGLPNMVLLDTKHKGYKDSGPQPLTKGKIQIQSEAAEVYYRDVKIRPIKEFPDFLKEATAKPKQ